MCTNTLYRTPDSAPSLMQACLQPPPLQTLPQKMRSDGVRDLLCPLHRACVNLGVPSRDSDRVWLSVYECWWGYSQGMGSHHSVLPDWLVSEAVYIVFLWPVKRNRLTADCSTCTRQSQTRMIIPLAWAGLVTMQTNSCSLPLWEAFIPDRRTAFLT